MRLYPYIVQYLFLAGLKMPLDYITSERDAFVIFAVKEDARRILKGS